MLISSDNFSNQVLAPMIYGFACSPATIGPVVLNNVRSSFFTDNWNQLRIETAAKRVLVLIVFNNVPGDFHNNLFCGHERCVPKEWITVGSSRDRCVI